MQRYKNANIEKKQQSINYINYDTIIFAAIPECTYDEFTCPEGWCTDYCRKCNGAFDGCIYGGDESYCGKKTIT